MPGPPECRRPGPVPVRDRNPAFKFLSTFEYPARYGLISKIDFEFDQITQ
jgi:hypothetical protein